MAIIKIITNDVGEEIEFRFDGDGDVGFILVSKTLWIYFGWDILVGDICGDILVGKPPWRYIIWSAVNCKALASMERKQKLKKITLFGLNLIF